MNDRIKQLAKEANLNSDEVPYHLSDYDEYDYPAVSKFAELIIQECIEHINEVNTNKLMLKSDADMFLRGVAHAGTIINQIFKG